MYFKILNLINIFNMTNKNSFGVSFENNFPNETSTFYKNRILDKARNLGLTISGEDSPWVRRGMSHCGKGNVLTVGTAKTHDVEWIERLSYAAEKGIAPIYNSVTDYNEIIGKLVKYADDKYGVRLSSGARVSFHKGFIKIDHYIIPNTEVYKIYVLTR